MGLSGNELDSVSYTASISTQEITGGKGNLKGFLYCLDPVLVGIVSCVPSLHSGKSHLCFQVTAALLSQQSPDPSATPSCHCDTLLLSLTPCSCHDHPAPVTAPGEHSWARTQQGGVKEAETPTWPISRGHHKSWRLKATCR